MKIRIFLEIIGAMLLAFATGYFMNNGIKIGTVLFIVLMIIILIGEAYSKYGELKNEKEKLLNIIGKRDEQNTLLSQFNLPEGHTLLTIMNGIIEGKLYSCYSKRFSSVMVLFFNTRENINKNWVYNKKQIIQTFILYMENYHYLCEEIYAALKKISDENLQSNNDIKKGWNEFRENYNNSLHKLKNMIQILKHIVYLNPL